MDGPMSTDDPPVIRLSDAPGKRESWDRPRLVVYLWSAVELLVVSSAWQPSSRVRTAALRAFGARIGEGVILRPRLRVRFPWKLEVGDHCWIGEDVWFHNQDRLVLGHNVVVSQGTLVTTGSHAFRDDMALRTKPIAIGDGAWVTSRCVVLAGADIGRSALVLPGTVVRGHVPRGSIFGSPGGVYLGERFHRPDGAAASAVGEVR
jgi:putative colanic acid biosynthesis acetyltransferase WcaF